MAIKNKSEILYEKTNISAYWIGFLSADGSFNNNGRIVVGLGLKDRTHLLKLKKYIKCKGKTRYKINSATISFMNKKIKKIIKFYGIKPNKTYHPLKDIPYKNKSLRLSFCVGFIDGDGSIRNYNNRKSFFLTIKNHNSWYKMLKLIGKELSNNCTIKINKENYSLLTLCNTTELKKLKKRMLLLNIPYMKRKWRIINLKYKSRMEDTPKKIIIIKKLLKKYNQKEIGKILKIKGSTLSLFIKRHNIKETMSVKGEIK